MDLISILCVPPGTMLNVEVKAKCKLGLMVNLHLKSSFYVCVFGGRRGGGAREIQLYAKNLMVNLHLKSSFYVCVFGGRGGGGAREIQLYASLPADICLPCYILRQSFRAV